MDSRVCGLGIILLEMIKYLLVFSCDQAFGLALLDRHGSLSTAIEMLASCVDNREEVTKGPI